MIKYLFFIFLPIIGSGQPPNCNVYLYKKDTAQYNACKSVEKVQYYQYTRQYQERFDKAIEICPYFAYAYSAKSTAYLKSGDFLTWKYLIDKAVQYDTFSHIGYRGWCRFQFFRDYEGAISDIEFLEKRISVHSIGYSAGGDYHLSVAKALCYSALNQKQKAIQILEGLFSTEGYNVGTYDYYQLAVSYFQVDDIVNATKYLNKQSEKYEFAENKFYQAKIAKIKKDKKLFESLKNEATKLYNNKNFLFDPYTEHFNKVYLSTIKNEMYE
ncbi:MAG: hypothetical protein IPM42_06035 [Saprospiraceae bacterium]|nr:hypothetical protein [Saprospiraceae bacterium]